METSARPYRNHSPRKEEMMRAIEYHRRSTFMHAVLAVVALALPAAAQRPAQDWSAVEQALGRRGLSQPDGVIRFGFPRSDLQVNVGDVRLLPAFALGSWVAFRPENGRATMMGDLVLTEDELTPVTDRLREGGIGVTAMHNHLQGETPRILYTHIHGRGDPARLAESVHAALALSKTPLGVPPAVTPVRIDLDTLAVTKALGVAGRATGGVYQVSVPRAGVIREGGAPLSPAMGVATAINFQPLGGGRAAITGDFVMIASEVDAVQRALRAHHIAITALHSHMTDEQPRLLFMHFWAVDDATVLAQGLRAALDKMAVARR